MKKPRQSVKRNNITKNVYRRMAVMAEGRAEAVGQGMLLCHPDDLLLIAEHKGTINALSAFAENIRMWASDK